MYCINCEQYLCNVCGNSHTKLKVAKAHKIVSIESGLPHTEMMKMLISFCNQHQGEALKHYCFDCKTVKNRNMMCFVEVHKTHNCCNIDKGSEEFQNRPQDDVSFVAGIISKFQEKEQLFEQVKI